MINSKGLYINGRWVAGQGAQLESINPANGEVLWQSNSASTEQIAIAYGAAKHALNDWALLSFEQRCVLIQRFAQQVDQHKASLAERISLETGKPLWESLTEVSAVIAKINLSIKAYQERTWPKETITTEATQCLRYKPHGVVVVLGAFNFPAHLSNGHIIPALLAGNTVLYKPSEQAPAVAELIMECWQHSELPAGVIQCLQGDVRCGQELLTHPIQGVYFTGSYATGLRIHQQFSNRPEVILALEMGGNNPLVIAEVDNMSAALYHTLISAFITAGQRCTCARRLIVPDSSFGDRFVQQLIQATQKIAVGSFKQQPEPFMGPVISHAQAKHSLLKQQMLCNLGGIALAPMQALADNTGFLSPGLIDMSAVNEPPDEEIFAPLLQIHRYQHFSEAINLANQTKYGLAAGLFSDNPKQYQQFYQEVHAGLINWNRPTTGAASSLPFGGVGLSGNHRPSAYFAADYCAYPIASMEQALLTKPTQPVPGIDLDDCL